MTNDLVPFDQTPEIRLLWEQLDAMDQRANAKAGGSTEVSPPLTPSGSGNRDIDAVVATISKLADGNCASAADVKLIRGDVATRPVRLMMAVQITWGSTKETVVGYVQVSGSLHCNGYRSANAHLAEVCGAACCVPALSTGVADRIRKAPVKAFADWPDTHKVADLPHAAHYYENCGNCAGHGVVNCANLTCRNGKTGCHHCRETGTGSCQSCQGQGSISVQGKTHYCTLCNGSGRFGGCIPCFSTGKLNCMTCHGRGEVRCNTCNGYCTFTHIYRTYLEGRVSRVVDFDEGVHVGFRASCLAVPVATLANGAGVLRNAEAFSAPAEASAVLHCSVKHAHVSMTVKNIGVTVDAIGTGMVIPRMPAFLDELIDVGALTSLSDRDSVRNPSARLIEATRASATKGILRMVGSGNAINAEAFSKTWKGAISPGFVTLIEGRLRRAYTHAARSSVRGTWIIAALPIAGAMFLANAYHLPLRVFESLWAVVGSVLPFPALVGFLLVQTLVAAPVLAVVSLYAGNRARASLRSGVGGLAKKRPRQGVWPWIGLLVAVAASWMAVVMRVEAAKLGLPFAPPLLWTASQPPVVTASPTRPAATTVRQSPGRDRLKP